MQLLSLAFGWSVLLATTSVQSSFAFSAASIPSQKFSNSALNVASVETPSVADMERGVGGRIEEAFAAAKEKGEAAFVTFVTAGYPTAAGKKIDFGCGKLTSGYGIPLTWVLFLALFVSTNRHPCYSHGHARGRCLCN